MKSGRDRIRISIDPSDLALEIISIVVAILLALTVNFIAGQVKTSFDVRDGIASIVSEMHDNRALIARVHERHKQRCAILTTLAARGRGRRISLTTYLNALDRVLPFVPPPLESTAWQLSQNGGVTTHLAYADRAALTRVYAQQQTFVSLGADLAADFRPVLYERTGDFFLVTRNAALDCSLIVRGEARLDTVYANEIAHFEGTPTQATATPSARGT